MLETGNAPIIGQKEINFFGHEQGMGTSQVKPIIGDASPYPSCEQ